MSTGTNAGAPSRRRLGGRRLISAGRRLAARQRLVAYGLIAPSLLLIIGVMAYPMMYNVALSFHTRILSRPALGTRFVGLANYIEAVRDPLFRQVFA